MRHITLVIIAIALSACALPKQSDLPVQTAIQEHQIQEPKLTTPESAPTVAADTESSEEAPAAESANDATNENIDTAEHDELFPAIDLWQRIRNNFSIAPQDDHKRLMRQLQWYVKHPDYMVRVTERAIPYLHFIVEEIEKNNVPMEIALLPIVESAFKPFAYSHGRAAGIWQFIPSTGRRYGLKQNWWYDGRRDVYASTQSAIRLLSNLAKTFDGDWLLALAAYNSGEGTVKRAIRKNKARGKGTDFWSLKLPPETRAYVPKLIALKRIVADPDKYNIKLTSIDDTPYFKRVDIPTQIDLAKVAELAEVDIDEVYRLNPAFNRWATSPTGPHYILLPKEKADAFSDKVSELPKKELIKWVRHRIRKGETIGTIANKYHTSISSIKKVNGMRGNFLREGHSLMIPVASKSMRSYKHTATQRRSKQQNIPRKGIKVTHIVRNGDTFWRIAQEHRVGVRQLAKWNGMAPRDTLKPGQKLIIWSRTGKQVSHNDPENFTPPPQRKIMQRVGYYVRKGDSLARIASKFRVSIKQLLSWNSKLKTRKYLQPGQRLTLYVDVTRQSS